LQGGSTRRVRSAVAGCEYSEGTRPRAADRYRCSRQMRDRPMVRRVPARVLTGTHGYSRVLTGDYSVGTCTSQSTRAAPNAPASSSRMTCASARACLRAPVRTCRANASPARARTRLHARTHARTRIACIQSHRDTHTHTHTRTHTHTHTQTHAHTHTHTDAQMHGAHAHTEAQPRHATAGRVYSLAPQGTQGAHARHRH
jgi:hypothetical protein